MQAHSGTLGRDVLAVSIGNVHGLSLEPDIDLDLLAEISRIAGDIPLVLHGGSGIPFDVIGQAEKHNLIKINYGSDIRHVFIKTIGEIYEQDHNAYNIMQCCNACVKNVSDRVEELVKKINGR